MKNIIKKSAHIFLCGIVMLVCAFAVAPEADAASLVWPVPGHTSLSRGFYIKSTPETSHYGIDITDGSIRGATVVAAMGGRVTSKYTCNANHFPNAPSCCYGFGNGIIIRGDDGLYYQYAHMLEGSIPGNVYVGAYVAAGAKVGQVGNTGCSNGNHLHFQMATGTPMNSYAINPANYTFVSSASWKNSASKVNLGDDFYARIVNTATNKALIAHTDNNVVIYDRVNSKEQIWRFTRNSDGSYTVINQKNGKALDVSDASSAAGANVHTYSPNGTNAQKWGVYGSQGNYVISAACTDCVIDIYNASSTNGTNVIMHTKHDGSNQKFTIEKISAPSKQSLNIGSKGKLTAFSWAKDSKATSYVLKITKDGSAYKTLSGLTSTSITVDLPNGIYTAVLTSKNLVHSTNSDTYKFTVNYNSSGNNDWQYATKLPSGVTTDKYVIEYKHTYKKVAKTSPGDGWTKGSVAKQEYENSGSVYWSNLPLATSATRVLVNYSYYHWCSNSKGNEANYTSTSVFNHYDGIGKDNVYEFYSHADYADSRYTFYGLKYKSNDSYVYCKSGTTCDGSYGSHGNRCYYWYKTYAYQDKKAVDYYTYTKQGSWTTVKDSSADSYTVRYRLIKECDGNHDYQNVIKKATLTADGKVVKKCACAAVKSTTVVYKPKSFSLSTKAYTYNGEVKKPKVTVKDSKGKVLVADKDYKVTYESGRKLPGKYSVRIDFIGKYKGTKRLYFTIAPKAPDVAEIASATDAIRLTWKKATGVSGYTVYQYKSGEWERIATITDSTNVTYRTENLKSGTTYKFKIKAYKKDDGTIFSKATAEIVAATKPATPKITSTAQATDAIRLNWNKVTGADGYAVYKYESGEWTKVATIKSPDKSTYRISGLSSGTTYGFKLKAYKISNGETLWSSITPMVSVTTK